MSRFSLIFDIDADVATGHTMPCHKATLFGAPIDTIAAGERRSRYNISRGQSIIVLRAGIVSRAGTDHFTASTMLWGFTPHWIHCAKPALQPLTITDTKVEQPYFREAFQQRRCLIPASGFYAWQGWENGPAAPYYVYMRDRQPFLMAAIWDTCEGIDRVAMITTAANELVQPIHERMPAIIPLAQADAWLRNDRPQRLLVPHPADSMEIYQVSRKIFDAHNEGTDLIAPLGAQIARSHSMAYARQ